MTDKHHVTKGVFITKDPSIPINRILMMAHNITLTVKDVIYRVNRRMDGIRKIIRIFITL